MNLFFRYFLFLLCLGFGFGNNNAVAQVTYDGQVLDKATEAPIPFATVTLAKDRTATRTNDQGYFSLNAASGATNDSLIFTSVGYQTYRVSATTFIKKMKVRLIANTTDLKQVSVSHIKKTKTLDPFADKDIYPDEFIRWDDPTFHIYSQDSPFLRMTMFAKLFEAAEAGAAITNIQMGRGIDRKLWFYTEPERSTRFKLHLYTAHPVSGAPDSLIFTKEVSLNDTLRRTTINFKPGELVLPQARFFVVVEWLKIPYNEFIEDKTYLLNPDDFKKSTYHFYGYYRTLYQPLMIGYEKKRKEKIAPSWMKIKNEWQPFQHPEYEVALSVTVNY